MRVRMLRGCSSFGERKCWVCCLGKWHRGELQVAGYQCYKGPVELDSLGPAISLTSSLCCTCTASLLTHGAARCCWSAGTTQQTGESWVAGETAAQRQSLRPVGLEQGLLQMLSAAWFLSYC